MTPLLVVLAGCQGRTPPKLTVEPASAGSGSVDAPYNLALVRRPEELVRLNIERCSFPLPGQGVRFVDFTEASCASVNPFRLEDIPAPRRNRAISDEAIRAQRAASTTQLMSAGVTPTVRLSDPTEAQRLNVRFASNLSTFEEARMLSVEFGGSYAFASFNAALSYARERRETSQSLYFFWDNIQSGPALSVNGPLRFRERPISEDVEQFDDRIRAFVETYGTHYIRQVNYGFRVAVRGTVNTLDDARRREFAAAFNGWGNSVSLNATEREKLTRADVEIVAEIHSGDITPITATVLRGFDDVHQFLGSLKSGAVTIARAPISALIGTYFPTLLGYPRSAAIFSLDRAVRVSAPFGVPSGTVLAWVPTTAQLSGNLDPEVTAVIPEGWVKCGSGPNTPVADGRFLRGARTVAETNVQGGTEKHKHSGTTGAPSQDASADNSNERAASTQHTHTFTTSEEAHLPPFVNVLYICKL